MPARLIKFNVTLLALLLELRYTLSRLRAHPLTSTFVPAFQALRDEWTKVQAQEISLLEDLSDAKAKVDIADAALYDFAVRFSNALLAITGQNRDASLYLHYFKRTLGEFRRLTMLERLRVMEDWLLSLDRTTHTTLAGMKTELQTLVDAGKSAVKARDTVLLKIRDFREVGERYQLFTKVNAERKEKFGALGKLALATPGLPSNFQDQFFKVGEVDEPEETVDSVEAEIKELEARLAERSERLAELKQEAAEAAKQAEERLQKTAKLAELKKDIAAKKKEAQALKDELG